MESRQERLLRAVHAVTVLAPELDDVAIAEVLWLAAVREGSSSAEREESESDLSAPATNSRDSSAHHAGPDAPPEPSPSEEPVSAPTPNPSGAAAATREVYENIAGSSRGAAMSGHSFATPRGSALPRSLELGRALRPFKRAWAPGPRRVLDIDATARDYARSGELLPTLRARPERFLDLALVVDRSPSMAVWQEVAEEFATVLNRLGAFKRVRTWDLMMDDDGQPLLRTKNSARADAHTSPPTGPRSQVIVLSDCSADGWYRPAVWRRLHEWGAASPTTLVNPLPSRLWRLTGLDLPAVRVTNPGAAAVRNTRLDYRRPWHLRFGEDAEVPLTPLPVTMLTPYGLESWARVLMSAGAVGGTDFVGCDAVLVPRQGRFEDFPDEHGDEFGYEDGDRDRDRIVGGGGPLSGAELIDGFLASASTLAARLAVMCAPYTSMTMPLLHLVRQTMVPEATLEEVAEVVVSGLFSTSGTSDGSPVLRPRPGVQAGLEELLGADDTWRMYEALTQYIAAHAGSLSALSAAITDPGGSVGLSAELRPFAAATVDTLRVLGALPPSFAGTATATAVGQGARRGGDDGGAGGEPGELSDRTDSGEADTDTGKLVAFHASAPQMGVSTTMASAAWILASHGKRVLVAESIPELPSVGHYLRPLFDEPDGLDADGQIPARAIEWDFPDGGTLDYLPDSIDSRDFPAADDPDYDARLAAVRRALLTDYDYVLLYFADREPAADAVAALTAVADVIVTCFPSGNPTMAGDQFFYAARPESSCRALSLPMGILGPAEDPMLRGRPASTGIPYRRTSLLENVPAVFIDAAVERGGLLAGIENLVRWITEGAITALPSFSESERRQIMALYARHGRAAFPTGSSVEISGAGVEGRTRLYGDIDMLDLLGIHNLQALDVARAWATTSLRLPIGVDGAGLPVMVGLWDYFHDGLGSHGLIVGAAGSGKRTLVRAIVTGLVATRSPETLNVALIGLTGEKTFAGMAGLPHLSALITKLADDPSLIDRMTEALKGEVARRQELLRQIRLFTSIQEYERARDSGAELSMLPRLLVVVDEFDELLTAWPDLLELFTTLGRVGQNLGIHLLMASRHFDERQLRGFNSHLTYRIALRTSSAAESNAVIGMPDAFDLPPLPGSAYISLTTGTEPPLRFKAAYAPEPEVIEALSARMAEASRPAHQIWLPPLDQPSTLDAILPALGVDPERGLCPLAWGGLGRLTVPLGVVDKPFEQRKDLLWVDLSRADGNVLVVGGQKSGKSTLVRTLISSLALTHTPEEVQFFILDAGGGALSPVMSLPHVSGYATRRDEERVSRVVGELTSLLAEREELFAQAGIHTMENFRARRSELDLYAHGGRAFGDVFLVIDDWGALREQYYQLEEPISTLAQRALPFGIHVVLTTVRSARVKAGLGLREAFGTLLELRLGDPSESEVNRRAASKVPLTAPGRGLISDGSHFLAALPRIDGSTSASIPGRGTADLVRRVIEAWPGEPAPQVRMLPRLISAVEVRALAPSPHPDHRSVPFGLSGADLRPVYADFHADPHFMAFGDSESGKTGLLRTLAAGIMANYTPDQAAIAVIDYRRSLVGTVSGAHLLGYDGAEPTAAHNVATYAEELAARIPGPDVTADQLRRRSWWTGPDLFVFVDDYELVAVPGRNPLTPLLGLLPYGRDIGLHLVIARRTRGAGRGLFEPVLNRMCELDTPGVVLSGDPDEGALIGTVKASPQPPGRGVRVHRRSAPAVVQVAWTPPDSD